jgi:hypothetical protein
MSETFPAMILQKILRFYNFLIGILLSLQEQQTLHYELHKTIALQRRISMRQADLLDEQKAKDGDA